jgi:hypothetical protein
VSCADARSASSDVLARTGTTDVDAFVCAEEEVTASSKAAVMARNLIVNFMIAPNVTGPLLRQCK